MKASDAFSDRVQQRGTTPPAEHLGPTVAELGEGAGVLVSASSYPARPEHRLQDRPSYFGSRPSRRRTSMRRHILSRPTWRPPCGRAQRLRVLRAMLPSALSMSPLFSDSVHRMRSVLIRTNRRRCNLRSGLCSSRGGWTKFVLRSRLMLDPKRSDTQEPYGSV
jgi:hypothetical protein